MVPPGGCPQRRTLGSQRPRTPSLPWSTLWIALALALAHTHIPTPAFSLSPATAYLPGERQLLPRLQCSRLSLQHRGEYLLATSTLRPGGRRAGTHSPLCRFTQPP